nr:EOG090X03WO [Triops cancriformis]
MDVLRAEMERKKRQLIEKSVLEPNKKYFRRGDLEQKNREEYLLKYGGKIAANPENGKSASTSTDEILLGEDGESMPVLSRKEVIRRLRDRNEPILLFGETEIDAVKRLRKLEILEPEINRGMRNDFQEALEQVDEAYVNEVLASHSTDAQKDGRPGASGDVKVHDDAMSYEEIQALAPQLDKGDHDLDVKVIHQLLKLILQLWGQSLNSRPEAEKRSVKGKMGSAIYGQTQAYVKPLLKKLRNKSMPDDILDSLTTITKHLLKRNYVAASDAYLQMAIGNAPWPIGVTMVGIHARTGREKIFSKHVAHVMNDETQRKYIQGLKRLMSKCQQFFATDPSRCVEYGAIGVDF